MKELLILFNLSVLPNVSINSHSINIIKDIREEYKGKLTVISTERTPAQQARIILNMYKKGVDINKLYSTNTTVLNPLLQKGDLNGLTLYFEKHRNFSKHLCGKALDLRVKDLTKENINDIIKSVDTKKYKVLLEKYPPHIHIELRGRC